MVHMCDSVVPGEGVYVFFNGDGGILVRRNSSVRDENGCSWGRFPFPLSQALSDVTESCWRYWRPPTEADFCGVSNSRSPLVASRGCERALNTGTSVFSVSV